MLAMVLAIIYFFTLKPKSTANSDLKIIEGIENFSIEDSEGDYILIYPADWRVSQDYTIVKNVTNLGAIVNEYKIDDEDFRRAMIHQKPNDNEKLYLSLFGEAVIQNWFYTFDLTRYKFKQVTIDYFDYDTGVNHLMHFGEDILFNTIVSHKTGDQVYNPETGDFKVSVSNFSKQESYETEWGLEPSWTPLVQFQNYIIYAGLGAVNEEGISENTFVAFINAENGTVESTNFERKGAHFSPIYANEKNAYILVDTGELIQLDANLDYHVSRPYDGVAKREMYYVYDGFLMLDETSALQVISDHDREVDMLGILTLSASPKFTPLEKDYLDPEKVYRILYQDMEQGLVFLIERSMDGGEAHVLVIDNEWFELVDRFPIEYSHLLDFVIKK